MKKLLYTSVNVVFPAFNFICRLLFNILNPARIRMEEIYRCKNFKKLDSDIFLISYPKSGMTWTQMLMFQLTTDGDIDKIPHLFFVSPFLEKGGVSRDLQPPRIIKTHMAVDQLPVDKGKYIYLMRNGLDVAVSYYHHYKMFNHFHRSFDDFYQDFIQGKVEYGSWFKHVSGWLKMKDDPRFLFISYEDMKLDLENVVRQIIDFCGLEITDEHFKRAIERSSMDYMKEKQHKIELRAYNVLNVENSIKGNLIRKGETGAHKDLRDDQIDLFNKQFSRYLAGAEIDHYMEYSN